MGYHMAGFDVTGIDIKPQLHYPFAFVQADAMTYPLDGYDVIHTSPPCQAFSPLRAVHKRFYPNLICRIRTRLVAAGVPWVIENVIAAPLGSGITLCGTMFGLRVYRHRRFETSWFMFDPEHPTHRVKAGGHKAQRQRKKHYEAGGFVTITGNVGSYCGPAMGIDWMTGEELSQAIPPAYTAFIGRSLLEVIIADD
jgi:DNA (cytosine-5)-methyltransferase 1